MHSDSSLSRWGTGYRKTCEDIPSLHLRGISHLVSICFLANTQEMLGSVLLWGEG